MSNELKPAPIVDLGLGVRIGLETNGYSGQYRVKCIRGVNHGEELHITLVKAHEFDKACKQVSAKELIDKGLLKPITLSDVVEGQRANGNHLRKLISEIITKREANLNRAIFEGKDLPTKMEMWADHYNFPADHILRTRASELREAVSNASAPPKKILGAWARARRVWCEHTGEGLI